MPCKASSTRSAPLGSLNFSTDSVAKTRSSFFSLFWVHDAMCTRCEECSSRRRPPPAVVVASREQVLLRKAQAERKDPHVRSHRQTRRSAVCSASGICYTALLVVRPY